MCEFSCLSGACVSTSLHVYGFFNLVGVIQKLIKMLVLMLQFKTKKSVSVR